MAINPAAAGLFSTTTRWPSVNREGITGPLGQGRGAAGTTGARYGNLDEIAWYWNNSNFTTHPVAKKKPGAIGNARSTNRSFRS